MNQAPIGTARCRPASELARQDLASNRESTKRTTRPCLKPQARDRLSEQQGHTASLAWCRPAQSFWQGRLHKHQTWPYSKLSPAPACP
eukprot:751329-Rhodomonas_salina.1